MIPVTADPTIIVVDDDAAVRSSLKFMLELDGYTVDTHESGEALTARTWLPRRACLVLDYALPGMNGLQLLHVLRSRNVDLPAVLITTNPTRSLRAEAAAAGAPIVEKPLLSNALLRSVERALAGGRDPIGAAP